MFGGIFSGNGEEESLVLHSRVEFVLSLTVLDFLGSCFPDNSF